MIFLAVILLWLCRMQYKKRGITASLFILSLYTLTACLSVIYRFVFPEDAYKFSFFSEIYYTVCLLILLKPIIRFDFSTAYLDTNKKLLKYVSYIVAFGGLIVLIANIINFDVARLAYSWAEQRNDYYSNMYDREVATTWYDRVASNFRHISYLCVPLFFYYTIKKNRFLSALLGIASISLVSIAISNASRQELIIFLLLIIFSIVLFYRNMTKSARHKLLFVSILLISGCVFLTCIITFSRFGQGDTKEIIHSLFAYSGTQPFSASLFLEDLHSQAKWGEVNFSYLTGKTRIGQLNDIFSASYYLNVFGSIVGSFYLDFGYFTIIFTILFSELFCFLLKISRKSNPVLYFYINMVYNMILMYGVFYFNLDSPESVRMIVLFCFLIVFIDILTRKNKYNYNTVVSNNE